MGHGIDDKYPLTPEEIRRKADYEKEVDENHLKMKEVFQSEHSRFTEACLALGYKRLVPIGEGVFYAPGRYKGHRASPEDRATLQWLAREGKLWKVGEGLVAIPDLWDSSVPAVWELILE
jgi:hypothetical protein